MGGGRERFEPKKPSVGVWIFSGPTQSDKLPQKLPLIIVFNTCAEHQFCRALLCENWFVEDFCCFLEQYIIQKPFSVLFGPCVFVGTLYPVTSEESIDIRMEYGISGPEESRVSLCFYLTVKLTERIQVKGSF